MTRPLVPSDAPNSHACEGCGKGMTAAEARWPVCLDCTKARHKAVIARGRCRCRREQRRPGDVVQQGPRRWIPCRRCLGMIEEVTP